MKWVLRITLGVVVLLIIAAVVVWLMIDSIAKTAIEEGGTYALGVETTVADVDVSILGGSVALDGLRIANPEGFQSEHLMKSGKFALEARTGSLFSDTIEVSKFELDGLDVNLEQKLDGSNITKVMENLKKLAGKSEETKQEEGPGKKIRVEVLTIRNVVAHVHVPALTGGTQKLLTINVPPIELKDVTDENAEGLLLSEFSGRLVAAVLAAVVEAGAGDIPAAFRANLSADIAGATKAMGDKAEAIVSQVGGQVTEMLDEGIREAGEATTRRAGELLEGILGGDED